MRLIDADAFCAFLREVSTRQNYETLLTHKDKYPTVADVIEAVCCDLDGTSLNEFDNAPTVSNEYMRGYEAAEREYKRPQGEWLKNANEIYKCSLCGAFGNPNYFRFCPECGAYMRGGAK